MQSKHANFLYDSNEYWEIAGLISIAIGENQEPESKKDECGLVSLKLLIVTCQK